MTQIKAKFNQFKEFRHKRKYEILLVSFLVLLFGDVFFNPDFDAAPILIIQNVLASIILFYGKKRWRLPLFILLVALLVIEAVNLFVGFPYIRLVFAITYIVYFLFISTEVYSQILKSKDVTIGTISAVLSGFIILGVIGGSVFSIIEVLHSGSFRNLSGGIAAFNDLVYFSFVTILSVGYGDITPGTEIAKKASMFFGLLGYFYGVVVIGIIIGKFISKKNYEN